MVNIDRMHVREAFKAYVSDYDLSDVKVKLKHIRQAIEQFIERRLLNDRQEYDTPIGKVCMSREEHEAYLEKQERYS